MSQNTTVHVSGIASGTSDKEVQDFFSFCGKITSISVTPVSSEPDALKSATVNFEKETATKTALLLDNTQLGPSTVHVTTAQSLDDLAGQNASGGDTDTKGDQADHHIPQEDKPRSRIVAEYLAHGYALSDQALQKAIALDQKHGVSNKFTTVLTNFDNKYNASDKFKGLNENYKISGKASSGWRGLNSYFEKALDTPSGRKLRDFYVKTDKQVRDIHDEARRLADLKSGKTDASNPAPAEEKNSGTSGVSGSNVQEYNGSGAAAVPGPTAAPYASPSAALSAPEAADTGVTAAPGAAANAAGANVAGGAATAESSAEPKP